MPRAKGTMTNVPSWKDANPRPSGRNILTLTVKVLLVIRAVCMMHVDFAISLTFII
jgi:hypothetical protein